MFFSLVSCLADFFSGFLFCVMNIAVCDTRTFWCIIGSHVKQQHSSSSQAATAADATTNMRLRDNLDDDHDVIDDDFNHGDDDDHDDDFNVNNDDYGTMDPIFNPFGKSRIS
jgi:hypothetical protein